MCLFTLVVFSTLKHVPVPRFEGLLFKFGGKFHAVRHLARLLLHLPLHYCPGFHSNPPLYQIAPVEKGEPGCEAVETVTAKE